MDTHIHIFGMPCSQHGRLFDLKQCLCLDVSAAPLKVSAVTEHL